EVWIDQDTLSSLDKDPLSLECSKDTIVLEFDLKSIRSLLSETLYRALTNDISQKKEMFFQKQGFSLKKNITEMTQFEQIERHSLSFFTLLIYGLCSYFWAANIFSRLSVHPAISTFYSIGSMLFMVYFCLLFILRSKVSLSFFGITKDKMKQSIKEGVLFSSYALVALLVIKYALIVIVPGLRLDQLFDIQIFLKDKFTIIDWLVLTLGYSVMVIFQELIARGGIQRSFEVFFRNQKHPKMKAIFISNLLFCLVHLPVSFQMAVIAFFLGCFWGWMYARTYNLTGVIISHIIIGNIGGTILGLLMN
ncbi:MAG: CPBP family intramembrane metalloprotease, partial [Chlamydiae bacterium]|nr:CPBP family intramembrane metalloprotease [Chlamydiota bacterium]